MNHDLELLRSRYDGYQPDLMDARFSFAVLCPLVEKEDGLHVLYEVRAATIRQAGETCFPGGRTEPGETPIECALRETEEELAIPRSEITILGQSDFISNVKGFLLRPVLALISRKGYENMKPSPAEVATTFTVPVEFFRNNEPVVYEAPVAPVMPEGFPYDAVGIPTNYRLMSGKAILPVWYYEGHAIWGMTARITRDVFCK